MRAEFRRWECSVFSVQYSVVITLNFKPETKERRTQEQKAVCTNLTRAASAETGEANLTHNNAERRCQKTVTLSRVEGQKNYKQM